MRFEGTDTYVATPDLMLAVNAAIALERPLLIKGEPGTGKTMLAEEVARALSRPLLQWHIKSTTIGRISAVSIAAGTYRSARASSGGIERRAKSAMNDRRDR